ncbi:hypothetical protein ACA910_022310 [Epithemia clementina (nom. ined.)]
MMRLFLLLGMHFVLVEGWSTGSIVSSFGGSVLITGTPNKPLAPSSLATLEMKKGKPNVPPQMRGQYARQKELVAMREQMLAASKPGDDGLPVFNLFVRSKKSKVWYPCGSFKGDNRSGALAKNYADGGLLAGISKKQLDAGIAGSLYQDLNKLKESIVRSLPQLKQSRNELEFGYKLAFQGLSEEKSAIMNIVEPKEQKGVFDNIKNLFS